MLLNQDACTVPSKILLTSPMSKNYYANNFNDCLNSVRSVSSKSIASSSSANLRILYFKISYIFFAQNLSIAQSSKSDSESHALEN